ncbi:hypothetical protein [Enterococcus sp. AZ196]|uniref:hypothetical protein n=1 Tax=Enterococcus sp. AZ196 TaxID=2774659 RepID=UPI003D28CEAB
MRELSPCDSKTSEGKALLSDPLSQQEQLWYAMLCSDRKNPRSVYCGDHRQPNVDLMGKPGQGKTICPIEDETHRFYNPETEKIADKLRDIGRTRK